MQTSQQSFYCAVRYLADQHDKHLHTVAFTDKFGTQFDDRTLDPQALRTIQKFKAVGRGVALVSGPPDRPQAWKLEKLHPHDA